MNAKVFSCCPNSNSSVRLLYPTLTAVIAEAVKELVGSEWRSERPVSPVPGAGHLDLVNGDGLGLEPGTVVFPPAWPGPGAGRQTGQWLRYVLLGHGQ